jgi:excisionase family DNA binding protein
MEISRGRSACGTQALQYGRSTVYDLVRSGALISVKIGKLRRIRISDLHTPTWNACRQTATTNHNGEPIPYTRHEQDGAAKPSEPYVNAECGGVSLDESRDTV